MVDGYDSAFWRFARETAARADAMPHWKWGPRDGCDCEWCAPKSTKASDVLGWMDSEGPVTRAPGKPADDTSHR